MSRGSKPGERRGGRLKGTPNKSTQSLLDKCKAKNIDVFDAMLEIALDPTHKEQASMLRECAQYLYPKRKSLEHSGSISPETLEASETISNLTKEEQIALLEAQLDALKDDGS